MGARTVVTEGLTFDIASGFWAVTGDTHLDLFLHEYSTPLPVVFGRGSVVIDCGANVGIFSRIAARAGAEVIAVEPAPDIFRALCLNLRGTKTTALNKAVSDQSGTAKLTINPFASGFNSIEMPRGTVELTVPVTTIDEIAVRARVDVIKMDIEGSEKKAITGARRVLNLFHPAMLIAVEHLADDREAIPALVNQLCPGYRHTLLPSRGMGDQTMLFEWREQ